MLSVGVHVWLIHADGVNDAQPAATLTLLQCCPPPPSPESSTICTAVCHRLMARNTSGGPLPLPPALLLLLLLRRPNQPLVPLLLPAAAPASAAAVCCAMRVFASSAAVSAYRKLLLLNSWRRSSNAASNSSMACRWQQVTHTAADISDDVAGCCALVHPVCAHLAVLPARLMQCGQAAQGSTVHPVALPKVVTQLAEGLCGTQATGRGEGCTGWGRAAAHRNHTMMQRKLSTEAHPPAPLPTHATHLHIQGFSLVQAAHVAVKLSQVVQG